MRYTLKAPFVAAAFFLTGGCGLVYESLWTRYLAELTGGTALSQLIVLMVFMGGLALGAILVGQLVDKRPAKGLFVYACLELGIGFYAILFPYLHKLFSHFYFSIGTHLGSGSAGVLVLKVLLPFCLIITPSIAMGGTLPAVTRYLTRSLDGLRANISLLYGINSLGAVVGILLGGFSLVYRYGIAASMQYTGLFNLIIGLAALTYAFLNAQADEFEAEQAPIGRSCSEGLPDCHLYNPAEVRMAIIIAGLSGFAAMALQVTWIRYFVIILGATHSSFTIVVAAFIFGIGLGSLLVRTKMVGRIYLPKILLSLMVLITTILWLYLFLYARLPFEFGRILGVFAHTPFAWSVHSVTKFGLLFLLMLLPSVASGMILPVCIRIAERGSDLIGRDVARIYAVNTISALLGILLTGQLLFRMFNLPHTLQAIMLFYLGATIFLIIARDGMTRSRILTFITVLLVVHVVFWRPWSPEQLFVSRVDFGTDEPLIYDDFLKYNKHKKIIKDGHGPDVHATVAEVSSGSHKYRALFINGKPDASTNIDRPIQILLGQIPVLLHPAPEDVFVLGLGSGISSGAILEFPGIEKVVTAELAEEVFESSKEFADYNSRFWENPRHKLVIDDGMSYLRLSEKKYDLICLQPSNIWQAGMPGLFSEDFFRLVKSRLKAGGLTAQWLHTYMADDLTVEIVIKTFARVFPHASVFLLNEDNLLLVGYDEQWKFDPQSLKRRFNQPQILELQKSIGNVNPEALLLREVMDRTSFYEYTRVLPIPINTLNYPILEKAAEYGLFMHKSSTLMFRLDSRTDPDDGSMLIHEYVKQVGFDWDQNLSVIKSTVLDDDYKLKESMNFMLLNKLWSEGQASPPQSGIATIHDAQLREIIMHPNYRKPVEQLTASDAYNLLGAELLVWYKAASQIWTPDPERLYQLYDRFASEVDNETAGMVARKAGFSLAVGRACNVARSFFLKAEARGALAPETMTPDEIGVVFNCEVTAGKPERASLWWKVIEEQNIQQTSVMKADKANLDIKLGGDLPPAIYGRLPER